MARTPSPEALLLAKMLCALALVAWADNEFGWNLAARFADNWLSNDSATEIKLKAYGRRLTVQDPFVPHRIEAPLDDAIILNRRHR